MSRITPSGRAGRPTAADPLGRARPPRPTASSPTSDGNLWLGEFHGNVLRCFSAEGEQIAALPLPAWNVTKAAFGGERGDLLYVTSARVAASTTRRLRAIPDTGGVFEVAGIALRRKVRSSMKITSLEPLVVDVGTRNWLFVVVETDEGVSGIGEGSLPGHPRAVAAAVEEYREYVVGRGPGADPAPLAADVPAAVLPKRRRDALGDERDRAGALGHQGKSGGPAGLRPARRPLPRPHQAVRERAVRLDARGVRRQRPRARRRGIHGDEDRRRGTRSCRCRATASSGAPPSASRRCATPSARTSRSPSTRTAASRPRCRSSSRARSSPTTSGSSRNRRCRRTRKVWRRSRAQPRSRSRRASGCSRSGRFAKCSSSTERRSSSLTSRIAAACSRRARSPRWPRSTICGFAPHNPLGPVNTIVSAHVGMATPNFVALEICRYAPDWTRGLLSEPLVFRGRYLELSDAPGWGVELDLELCRAHPYQRRRSCRFSSIRAARSQTGSAWPTKVRIGFVGAGFMGQLAHIRSYALLHEECELVAFAEPRQRTAQLVAARYGIGRVYRDHRELLESEQLDGIVAAQSFTHHAALLPELYPHVRHLFTEKPLALSAETGDRLAALAREEGCVHMLGYQRRSDPATVEAKRSVDAWKASGELGRLRYLRICFHGRRLDRQCARVDRRRRTTAAAFPRSRRRPSSPGTRTRFGHSRPAWTSSFIR